MKITTRDDGKVTLDFIAKGHNYSDASTTLTLAEACKLLAPTGAWMEEHLINGKTYNIAYLVDYTWGKIKPHGDGKSRYRNVDGVRLPTS